MQINSGKKLEKLLDGGPLDKIDLKILDQLARNGRLSITELSERVGLSKTPCQLRVKRLQGEGYILGFRAVLDPARLGRTHIAFVEITLSDSREAALSAFNAAVRAVPEIEQCHMIAGSFDYLLKIRSKDIQEYRSVLGEIVSNLPYVANTSTHVSMEAVKEDIL